MGDVRVRFAPSPTGYLHVGGARTALYNWLFARHHGGKFLLRIEDTDVKRSTPEMTDNILKSLEWLGLTWDEELVYQSQRLEIYREVAKELVNKGLAYYCYTPEGESECIEVAPEEAEGKKVAIRFRVPKSERIEFTDLIRGHIVFEGKDIKDFVIMKSDGYPTYQLAVVVDDHSMGITHVIRGEDHIPNTPKQILIYRAMGWELPQFAHLPMILGPDKKKLSKRHGAVSVLEYRRQGYLSEALFNFLALLGWSPGEDREIVPKDEMISLFDIKKVGKRAAVFDMQKLNWINSVYIRMKTDDELLELLRPFFSEVGVTDDEAIRKLIPLYKERARTLRDFVELSRYFFEDVTEYDEKGVKKHFKRPTEVASRLETCLSELEKLENWTAQDIEGVVRGVAESLGVSAAKLIHPIRLSITGMTFGPGLFELMEALGKETVLNRLRRAIEWLKMRGAQDTPE